MKGKETFPLNHLLSQQQEASPSKCIEMSSPLPASEGETTRRKLFKAGLKKS